MKTCLVMKVYGRGWALAIRKGAHFASAQTLWVLAALATLPACASPHWQKGPMLPEARWFHSTGVAGDQLFVAGGTVSVEGVALNHSSAGLRGLRVYPEEGGGWSEFYNPPEFKTVVVWDVDDPARQEERTRGRVESEYALVGGSPNGDIYWFDILGPVVFHTTERRWSQPNVPKIIANQRGWKGKLPPVVHFSASVASSKEGKIYISGGRGFPQGEGEKRTVLTRVSVYDTQKNEWSVLPPFEHPRQRHASALGPDGKLYVFGGCRCSWNNQWTEEGKRIPPQEAIRSLVSAEVYDPTTGSWSPIADMPTPRQMHGAVTAPNGKIFVIGGARVVGESLDSVDIYDPARNSWSRGPSLRTPRHGLAATRYQNAIFVTGGMHSSSNPLSRLVGAKHNALRSVEMMAFDE